MEQNKDFSYSFKAIKGLVIYAIHKKDYWFIIYNLALCYKKIGNFDKSIELAMESIKYTKQYEHGCDYISSLWLIGVCYMEMELKSEAHYWRLHTHYDFDDDELLTEMYSDLVKLYFENNLREKAYSMMYSVNNRLIKILLSDLITTQNRTSSI